MKDVVDGEIGYEVDWMLPFGLEMAPDWAKFRRKNKANKEIVSENYCLRAFERLHSTL